MGEACFCRSDLCLVWDSTLWLGSNPFCHSINHVTRQHTALWLHGSICWVDVAALLCPCVSEIMQKSCRQRVSSNVNVASLHNDSSITTGS